MCSLASITSSLWESLNTKRKRRLLFPPMPSKKTSKPLRNKSNTVSSAAKARCFAGTQRSRVSLGPRLLPCVLPPILLLPNSLRNQDRIKKARCSQTQRGEARKVRSRKAELGLSFG